ncbi:MAG TPA: hypothetical protein VG370_30525 [Chloroflexota bacterium]|nr:hypothetical protein [Chloroflexota bacterium]
MVDDTLVEDGDDGPGTADPRLIDDAAFHEAFGEPIDRTLDLGTWNEGDDLDAAYERMRQQVADAVRVEGDLREKAREHLLPRLRRREGMGVFQMPVDEVEKIHKGLLFTGQVEACDGTSIVHDTLPLTVSQVGVCIVTYAGRQNSWVRRTYRRDLRIEQPDPVEDVIEALTRRERRSSDMQGRFDQLSALGRRGIMTYGERAILREKGGGRWYMGHGAGLPWELLTGSGSMRLLDRALGVLEWQWLEHKRSVYVPSSASRMLLTIGNALRPLEYALVDAAELDARWVVDSGHYEASARRRVEEFVAEVGPHVVVGVFRASRWAPAYAFHAHREYAHLAARIAIADAALQEHRGFPVLIDLADTVCRATFGGGAFLSVLEGAYADAGVPWMYLPERTTRRTR